MRTILLLAALMMASRAAATTYYIDYINGNDASSGTSKTSAWKHAPGMNHVSGIAASAKINPGDKIIFRGCQHWLNESFPWHPRMQGTAANPIYVGFDPSWWDNKVTGCEKAGNRPVLDLQRTAVENNSYVVVALYDANYVNFDGFEMTSVYCQPVKVGNTSVSTNMLDWGNNIMSGVVVSNWYIHGWFQPFVAIGTGDVTAGSAVVTNFVPYPWSPFAPSPSWPGGNNYQSLIMGAAYKIGMPQAPNGNVVQAISGSNPYTITGSNPVGSSGKGVFIQIGVDACNVNGGASSQGYPIKGQLTNVLQNSVIDGSDTNVVAMNPDPDCGLKEGNKNWCIAVGTAVWRVPSILRNNIFRFVSNGLVGDFTEWSGNTLEYFRLSSNPSSHTNAIESTQDIPYPGVATLAYNNVFRHFNNPNPNLIGPAAAGQQQYSIGLGNISAVMVANELSFQFNNVMYDTLQNAVFENISMKKGNGSRAVVFNNTADCGPSWSLTFGCVSPFDRPGDIYQNNLLITSSEKPNQACPKYGGFSKCTTGKEMTPGEAAKKGYKITQDYAYSPTSSHSPTVGKGTSNAEICKVVARVTPAAGVACLKDTTYGVNYDRTTHTVKGPSREPATRPTAPDIGAYQFEASSEPASSHP